MNIIHIITTIERGGAENQLIQNLLIQKSKSIDVNVLFLKGYPYWRNYLREKNIKVFGPFFNKFYYFNLFGLFSFYKKIKNARIIHCHMPPSLLLVFFVSLFIGKKKIIYTSHNDEKFIPIGILDNVFSKLILNKADKIIAITLSVKKFLIKRYKLNSEKIIIIRYSFDPVSYKEVNLTSSNEFDFYKNDYIYIGTVARLVSQKRIDLLIKAFKEVNKQNNKIKLVILGNGNQKKKLLTISNSLNLSNNIIWINYSEYVIQHMKYWSLFCLTSQYEGFGLVLLEAIYAKLPILAMNVSSIKDIVGPCGELVQFGDYLNFSEKIQYVLKNKNNYLENDYLMNFDPEANFQKHLNIYNSLKS